MIDAMARSIAETAADILGRRSMLLGLPVPDEVIGLYFWHERGVQDHDSLVRLITNTREIIDQRHCRAVEQQRRLRAPHRAAARRQPLRQLSHALVCR